MGKTIPDLEDLMAFPDEELSLIGLGIKHEILRLCLALQKEMKTVQKELLAGKAAHDPEARNRLAREEEKPRRVLVQPLVKGIIKYRNEDIHVENLKGIIRRLEKSNEELGLALHKCQNPGEAKGWD